MLTKDEIIFLGVVGKTEGQETTIIIFPDFSPALDGIEQFSHLVILYWFHQRADAKERRTIKVIPRRHAGAPEVGVFACRSPSRPNPIGLCVVELVRISGNDLFVRGLDAADGSPIVDIKPYLPKSDFVQGAKVPDWALRGPST